MGKKRVNKKFVDDYEDAGVGFGGDSGDESDGMSRISFGALKSAQDQLYQSERRGKSSQNKQGKNTLGKSKLSKSTEDKQEGLFEEEFSSDSEDEQAGPSRASRKHAPKEFSAKKPVSKIRKIPGLDGPSTKTSSLYQDIRFDSAMGKSDLREIRKNYKFLDDYRLKEAEEIGKVLKTSKNLSERDRQKLEMQAKSLKSRVESMQNHDLEEQILKEYYNKHKSASGNKFYLKDSEKRKVIQKYKFEHMKSSQIEKVVERKRKRRLGKELKQLEFSKPKH